MSELSLEECERIVKKVYAGAHAFGQPGMWSISIGAKTPHGHIRIPDVGFHERLEDAWLKAAELCRCKHDRLNMDGVCFRCGQDCRGGS